MSALFQFAREIRRKRQIEDRSNLKKPIENKRECVENSTNWNDLPAEIKLHCIKWMDLRTRSCLRGTSRTEKKLVEYKRYPIDRLEVVFREEVWLGFSEEVLDWEIKTPFENELFGFCQAGLLKGKAQLEMTLRLGDIKDLIFRNHLDSCLYNEFSLVSVNFPVKISNFFIEKHVDLTDGIFQNCQSFNSIVYSLDEARLNDPEVFNSKSVVFKQEANHPHASQLVEKWIEHDCEIGQRSHLPSMSKLACRKMRKMFAEKFKTRIITSSRKEIRISTNNNQKNVILRVEKNQYGREISIAIMPAELTDESAILELLKPMKGIEDPTFYLNTKQWAD